MARVTVEDCLAHVENRFQLVIVAAKRAKQLEDGDEPRTKVRFSSEKTTVIALREIAEGKISVSEIEAIDSKRQQINLEFS